MKKHFQDITSLLDYIKPAMTRKHTSWDMSDESWGGCNDFPAAVNMLENGWESGTEKVAMTAEKIKAKIEYSNPQYSWDVTGEFFDVATMLSGEPEHWQQPSYDDGHRRVITIVSNLFFSASTPAHQINNRGAAIVALIDSLQQDPKNIVEVKLVLSIRNSHSRQKDQEFWIDMGSSPLDIDTLSFALVSPAMCRRIGFGLMDIANNTLNSRNYGYHKKPDCSDLDNPQLFDTWGTSDGMSVFNSVESSARWVEKELDRINSEA